MRKDQTPAITRSLVCAVCAFNHVWCFCCSTCRTCGFFTTLFGEPSKRKMTLTDNGKKKLTWTRSKKSTDIKPARYGDTGYANLNKPNLVQRSHRHSLKANWDLRVSGKGNHLSAVTVGGPDRIYNVASGKIAPSPIQEPLQACCAPAYYSLLGCNDHGHSLCLKLQAWQKEIVTTLIKLISPISTEVHGGTGWVLGFPHNLGSIGNSKVAVLQGINRR